MSRKIRDAQSRYIRSRLPKLLRVQIKSFCKTWVKLTMHLQPMERIGDQSHKLWIVLICFDVGPGKGRAFQLLRLVVFTCFYHGSSMMFNDFQRERWSLSLEPSAMARSDSTVTRFAFLPPPCRWTPLNAATFVSCWCTTRDEGGDRDVQPTAIDDAPRPTAICWGRLGPFLIVQPWVCRENISNLRWKVHESTTELKNDEKGQFWNVWKGNMMIDHRMLRSQLWDKRAWLWSNFGLDGEYWKPLHGNLRKQIKWDVRILGNAQLQLSPSNPVWWSLRVPMLRSRCTVDGAYINRNSESGTIMTLCPTHFFWIWYHK